MRRKAQEEKLKANGGCGEKLCSPGLSLRRGEMDLPEPGVLVGYAAYARTTGLGGAAAAGLVVSAWGLSCRARGWGHHLPGTHSPLARCGAPSPPILRGTAGSDGGVSPSHPPDLGRRGWSFSQLSVTPQRCSAHFCNEH